MKRLFDNNSKKKAKKKQKIEKETTKFKPIKASRLFTIYSTQWNHKISF